MEKTVGDLQVTKEHVHFDSTYTSRMTNTGFLLITYT